MLSLNISKNTLTSEVFIAEGLGKYGIRELYIITLYEVYSSMRFSSHVLIFFIYISFCICFYFYYLFFGFCSLELFKKKYK